MAQLPMTSGRRTYKRPAREGGTHQKAVAGEGKMEESMKERLPKLGRHLRLASGAILGAMALALVATWAGVARAQSPDTSSEPGFIKNLHITGFAQNTSATWIESNNMRGNFGTTSRASGTTQPGTSDRWG